MENGFRSVDGRRNFNPLDSDPIWHPRELIWPEEHGAVPDWVYTDPRIAELEQHRVFEGATWNYVGLEVEVPKPGDYIRSYVGSVPVLVVRDRDGEIRVFENRCAHRGVEFCRAYAGNAQQFICPYHQWTYDLAGTLTAVPFRRGVRGEGGMPATFQLAEHGLRRFRVTRRNGVVFASLSDTVEPLEEYFGPEITAAFDTVFDGRELMLLGRHRNTLSANWKLYQENLKDPYHATLLHVYFTTFGLFVAGNKTKFLVDSSGRHHASLQIRPEERPKLDEEKREIIGFNEKMPLHDPSALEHVKELNTPWSAAAVTIWPNLVLVRNLNILGMRHIIPNGPNECLLVWTVFGYADDSPELKRHRLRQNNLFGPGGFVGVDDHEVMKFAQDGQRRAMPRDSVMVMGGDESSMETPITEMALRSMYRHYRATMGL